MRGTETDTATQSANPGSWPPESGQQLPAAFHDTCSQQRPRVAGAAPGPVSTGRQTTDICPNQTKCLPAPGKNNSVAVFNQQDFIYTYYPRTRGCVGPLPRASQAPLHARTLTHRHPRRVPKTQVFTYTFLPASVSRRPAVRPLRMAKAGTVFWRLSRECTLSPGNLFLRSGSGES